MKFVRTLFGLLLGKRLPRTRGTFDVPGLRQSATIFRDQWGVPHIEARCDHDAWFALGYCQAQDRGFQLETILRVSRGTLAELVGERGLPVDRLSRRVGFVRSAQAHWPVLEPDIQAIITAFAAGITAGQLVGLTAKPHELSLIGGQLTPWTPQDVLAFVKFQSFILPSNWDAELARLQILIQDGESALRDLDPTMRHLNEEFAAFRAMFPEGGGSNNWVIAPGRTATGRPIVCNDPHLLPTLPSQWYLAHLTTPEWSVAGGTFAGSPGFAAAYNGHIAWGTTAGLIDNTDLFIERPDEAECVTHREEIRVKGRSEPVIEEVRVTLRGPIISPVLAGDWPMISIRASWLEAVPVRGYLGAVRARNGEEFRRCFASWPALPANLVYADTSGAIGYQLAGSAPRRRSGTGTLPKPGWDPSFAWDGVVPFDEMPHVVNPPAGFIATANNPPPGHERDSPLGNAWMDTFRLDAIREALSQHNGWTITDCLKLQTDLRSLPWRAMRDVVLGALATAIQSLELESGGTGNGRLADETGPSLREIAETLHAWDGVVAPESRAAAVFELFAAEMIVRLARARAPKSFEWFLGKIAWNPGINLYYLKRMQPLIEILREQPAGWFDQTWTDVIVEALRSAATKCAGRAWGQLHTLRPKSLVLGDRWLLGRVFSLGPVPVGGDADTINQASLRPLRPIGETDNIAGLRMAADVGNWSASRFSIAGGQSGNPMSPHYGDLFEYWRRGEGIPIAWTHDEVVAAARETLTLRPA